MSFIGWLLGFDHVRSIDSIGLSLSAPWAAERTTLVFACCVASVIVAMAFYGRLEERRGLVLTRFLIAVRAALLVLLVLTLAAPLLRSSATTEHQPKVLVVIDNTQSMSIADGHRDGATALTRAEQVAGATAADESSLLARLRAEPGVDLRFATFSGDGPQQLQSVSPAELPGKLSSDGRRTDLGAVLRESAARSDALAASAMILVSDFANNADGSPATAGDSALESFPVRIATVGVGRANPVDLAVAIRGDAKGKLQEPVTLQLDVRQLGHSLQEVEISMHARPLMGDSGGEPTTELVYSDVVTMKSDTKSIEVPYVPSVAGPIELTAKVEPLAGEVVSQNNIAVHRIDVIADHLRLLFVEHEPTWEWRFVKEVFHRDRLVGLPGLRTFLASSDPAVRRTNGLFLPEVSSSRAEFFLTDAVVIGDVPGEALSAEFCGMVEEFVGDFGGGLVVLSGPRFGPTELLDTPLASMLPVRLDAESEPRDDEPFALHLTGAAERYPFMKLADAPDENDRAWGNLARLPWYLPVTSVHDQADVLAEHPDDLCSDGETPQPLIAIRPYGKGQVVYVGFNELWRLRSGVGQRYHQRFWSQLIYRLGMSHPVGARKRFVPQLDRDTYRVGDQATLTIDVFDEDFQPLRKDAPNESPFAALLPPSGDDSDSETLQLARVKDTRYQASFELDTPGEYHLEISDPVTNVVHHETIRVLEDSIELQNPARDIALQRIIAERTGGNAYELDQIQQLFDDLSLQPVVESEHRVIALWHTPLWFIVVAGLMLTEWTTRRWVHLR